jgi:translocation and assembly module TamB
MALIGLGLIVLAMACKSPAGRTAIERSTSLFSGGKILLTGLNGDLSSQFSVQRIELRDSLGSWLTIDELLIDWQPRQLLSGFLAIQRLQAHDIKLERPPKSNAASKSSGQLSLPLNIDLRSLSVERFEIAAPLAGEAAVFSIDGLLRQTAKNRGESELHIIRLKQKGAYNLQASLTEDGMRAQISLHESTPGPLATLLGMHKPAALNLDAELAGPLSAVRSHLDFSLDNLRAQLDGDVDLAQNSADLKLTLPDLQPIAALSGEQLAGSGQLQLKIAWRDGNQQLKLAGLFNIRSSGAWAKLLSKETKLDLSVQKQGEDIALSELRIADNAFSISAAGGLSAGHADFNWQARIDDLSAIFAGDSGRLAAQGRLSGELGDLTLTSDINSELASKGYSSGPIHASLRLQHLPSGVNGRMTLDGELFQAPVAVQLTFDNPEPKSLRIDIVKFDWKSLHALGGLQFTPDNQLPVGKVDLRIGRLADLQALIKQPLTGSLNAGMESSRSQARLSLTANDLGLEGGATINGANLALSVNDPTGRPRLQGELELNGVSAWKLNASAQIKLDGALDALNLRLSAALPNLSGSEAQINGAAIFNSKENSLLISALQADWRQQSLRLRAPANVSFKNGLSIDRLRLGTQQAELELGGRIAPELALSGQLRISSLQMLSLFDPALAMKGAAHADANLHGSLMRPTGLLRVDAEQLQMDNSQGLAMPPGVLTATAALHGESADLDVVLKAGDADLRIAGQLPLTNKGLIALQGKAALDLKQFDPLLNAAGRRARGQFLVDGSLSGDWLSPVLNGGAQLNHGEWQDFTTGVVLNDITATVAAEAGMLRIVKLQARAGSGTLSAAGSVDLLTQGMPINMTLTASNAQPLASDKLTVNLGADITLGGLAAERMTASGRIHVNRADIRIPERMPAGIAVLKQRLASPPPLPPAEANSNIKLNLTIDAPSEIFIRGRGVDAELGGTLSITGDVNNPSPEGGFKLRSGQFTLAGQALVFNQGSIEFDNNNIRDPVLNFVANTTRNNITATLTVTGSAQHPKIALSSSPTLPEDEVLANLLFGKGSANLSPLEMAQIAATLASLTGVGAGAGDQLDSLRRRLGLDRLSTGGGVTPSLEAGRYIAPGVYLGAKQGIAGGAPQPTIQIDITKHLKLEGSVGSGATATSAASSAATNSAGVIYQFEY